MLRIITFLALSLVLALRCSAAEPSAPAETVVKMTVEPMAAPIPALKYQLLPEMSEMNPGNPVQGYLRSLSGRNGFLFGKQSVEERRELLTMPLKDIPIEKLNAYYGGDRLADADYSARLDVPDWQILLRMKSVADLAVPDVQEIGYTLVDALAVRLRCEIAGRRFDNAMVTAKTMFAISRHLGEHPSLVGALYGYDVAHRALDRLEEMIQQPGCPNLYWALTNLPNPLIDLEKGAQSERMLFAPVFSLIEETAPMNESRVQRAIDGFTKLIKDGPDWETKTKEFTSRLNARAESKPHVAAARKRLIDAGVKSKIVEQFGAVQVVLLDAKREYEIRRDDMLKLTPLPYWQTESAQGDSDKSSTTNERPLFDWITADSAVSVTRMVQTWRQQRIALLRCVEALRLFAADHDGNLPARLADLTVPVPFDPVTGKSFSYRLEGTTAILHGTPTRERDKEATDTDYNRRYEITIQK
ncbi:MAG TPA: hypothetical protein VGY55_16845 [Pirellulales bacterium]|jgi:hypothetical protein|nr:hypothetical protein [Pirellulales bacterium]